jgi:LPS-assembly protein
MFVLLASSNTTRIIHHFIENGPGRMKKRFSVIAAISLCYCSATLATHSFSIAQALGWQSGKSPDGSCNLCNGYYTEPKTITDTPNPPPYQTVPITITTKGPTVFREDGVSVLKQHVEIKQPGRLIQADKALVYRNKKTGQLSDIQLIGHVRIYTAGKTLVGDKADYNIEKNTLSFQHAVYHILGEHQIGSVSAPFNAWGTAQSLHRDEAGVIHLKNATYSTCSPIDPAWIISAEKMDLDRKQGEGYAHNIVIRFKKIPIFYSPYYSFALNAARKSGFLSPSLGYANTHGFYFAEPYYWNIAPNYDLLVTPEWYSKRGAQLNSLFRYLTNQSDGFLYTSFMPDDRAFGQFRQNTLNSFASNPSSATTAPYLAELQSDKTHRGFIDFQNDFIFNRKWSGKLYARYLSDPYFAEDFQSAFLKQHNNQIPSFAELDYTGLHWHDTFLAQSWQTLHPIDQVSTPAQNQYTRLPELDANANYPGFVPHYDFALSAQAIKFNYESTFYPLTFERPVGDRLHLQPSISRPFLWSYGFFKPAVIADTTSYFSDLQSATPTAGRPTFDVNRTLPIVDIDSGLYFDHAAHIGGKNYIQTLEPRVFYLYTPYVNQDNYPNFDTQLLPFSTTNLYTINQFTGFDRIQNANQVSLGLTSNLLRAYDASNVLSAQVGLIDYFTRPHVCLLQECPKADSSISPIAGTLTWTPNPLWTFNTQTAWDTGLEQINNAQIGAQYHWQEQHIITLNYQFAHGNPDTPFDSLGFSTNSSLLTAGLLWPLTDRWHFFGYSYYDLTHRRPQNQYVGLSYNTCCWAVRIITADNFNGMTSVNGGKIFQNEYTTSYYLEFLLKGLGSAGNRHAEDMLTSTLPGYEDVFSNRGHYGYAPSI